MITSIDGSTNLEMLQLRGGTKAEWKFCKSEVVGANMKHFTKGDQHH